jgi:hypothetical protein
MLGCNDFCGYYDWTFGFVRRRWGQDAVRLLWSDAIGGESQQHYTDAGLAKGLRGLYEAWTKTGHDEKCDWTFTLDEQRNVLRWDMRQCPSKGFLLQNDLNADEDYCDHCMGWMVPLLAKVGVEVAAHEHNHCGQCWGEMRVKGKPYQALELPIDIRQDPRWNRGYLDRFRDDAKLPARGEGEGEGDSDSLHGDHCELLQAWFARHTQLLVVGSGPFDRAELSGADPAAGVMMTDLAYVEHGNVGSEPPAVLIGNESGVLPQLARRFLETEAEQRPLLLHAYLPAVQPIDFVSQALPRPAPILPLLIRAGAYRHEPGGTAPSTQQLLALLAVASGKPVRYLGFDAAQRIG